MSPRADGNTKKMQKIYSCITISSYESSRNVQKLSLYHLGNNIYRLHQKFDELYVLISTEYLNSSLILSPILLDIYSNNFPGNYIIKQSKNKYYRHGSIFIKVNQFARQYYASSCIIPVCITILLSIYVLCIEETTTLFLYSRWP